MYFRTKKALPYLASATAALGVGAALSLSDLHDISNLEWLLYATPVVASAGWGMIDAQNSRRRAFEKVAYLDDPQRGPNYFESNAEKQERAIAAASSEKTFWNGAREGASIAVAGGIYGYYATELITWISK